MQFMDVSSLKAAGDISTFFDWIPRRRHIFEKVKPAAEHATKTVQATCTTTLIRSTVLFLIAAGLLGESGAASAQSPTSYPWCARIVTSGADGSGDATSCYYTSREQCMTTISGIGVYCFRSPYYHATAAKATAGVRRHRAPN
jgi:Protein of unknown function (DUF3551)